MIRVVRLKIGDVFEIVTSNGTGLFQYVHKDETIGELLVNEGNAFFQK